MVDKGLFQHMATGMGEKRRECIAASGVDAILTTKTGGCCNGNVLGGIEDPRFSSSFSVVFLNFFHHDANSRLEGGGIAACVITGAGAPRGGI